MQRFSGSLTILCLGIILGLFWGGLNAALLILMLSILEISLSFDNAIINAKILHTMPKIWQTRFLTWGIIIAVFGMRFILPIFIVSVIADLNFFKVISIAINHPKQYQTYLAQSHYSLAAFGGMFLFMVFISFLFDPNRSIHWLGKIEKKMGQLGHLKSIEIIVALFVLLSAQSIVPHYKAQEVLIAGIIGIILYVLIDAITALLQKEKSKFKSGGLQFIYLEILDASFSLDGVMGAFAMTHDIVIIMIGLTIGAIFVRSITIFLVHKSTIKKYQYLEHGAYYAIGALAILMLLGLAISIPDIIIGCIGAGFIGLSLVSSIMYNKKNYTS